MQSTMVAKDANLAQHDLHRRIGVVAGDLAQPLVSPIRKRNFAA